MNILFTDKTGTLTQGRLNVSEFISGDGNNYDDFEEIPELLKEKVAFSLRNNTTASIDLDDIINPKIIGANPTEKALLSFLGSSLSVKEKVKMIKHIPFKSSYKFSASQIQIPQIIILV